MMTTKSANKTTRSTKIKAAPVDALVLNHTESIESISASDEALNDLIASLNAEDEVIEPRVESDLLSAAVSSAEAIEAIMFAATPAGVTDLGAVPTGDVSDVVVEAAAEEEDTAPAAEKKVKKAAVPRKHYSDKTERLKDKLGAGLSDYSVLTLADAGVTDTELSVVTEATMIVIRSMSGKAQNWAVKLIEFLAGKKSTMSEVTARIFKLLEKDGFISTGATGNLYLNLISKPYSPGAARAMGGNNLAMMMHLKIIAADGKGRFVANPDSLLLMKANQMLFSGSAASAEEDAELGLTSAEFETTEAEAEVFETEDMAVAEAKVEKKAKAKAKAKVEIKELEEALL